MVKKKTQDFKTKSQLGLSKGSDGITIVMRVYYWEIYRA